ncbi:MAG: ABC transporter substrate-binding protein [Trueperaceae bacterium]
MNLHRVLRAAPALLAAALIILTTFAVAQENLAEEQVLRVGLNASDIGTLDPHATLLLPDSPIKYAIFEGLLQYNEPGNVASGVAPGLAERWESSEDGAVWTFHLSPDVQWHRDNGMLSAQDVVYSFERALDPERSSVLASPVWQRIESVEAIDDMTVQVTLSTADPLYDIKLASQRDGQVIVPQAAVEGMGDDEFAANPIGSGPFMFESYSSQDEVVLVANDEYYEGEPVLERIEFKYVPSLSARNLALQQGELHMAFGNSDPLWIEDMRSSGITVDLLGPGFTGLLMFNLNREPVDNHLVRQAIAHAINREALSALMAGPPQISPLPEDGWLFATNEGVPAYEYDLERSQELLAEAGYPDGVSLGEQVTSESSYYRPQLEAVQSMLADANIELDLSVVDHATFHQLQGEDANALPLFGGGGFDGLSVLTQFFHEDGGLNFSHYTGVSDLLDQAAATADVDEIERIMAEVQRKLLEDLAVYPTVTVMKVLARQPYVDLGYEAVATMTDFYALTEETAILQPE